MYQHTLTEIETACGVTLDAVARELPRVLIRDYGATIVIDGSLSPALSASVARAAFAGTPHDYAGCNRDLNLSIYRAL